jgi:transcriptional regulator with XRE-family HTH domain
MDDLAVGRVFRAARVKRHWRQDDVAGAAGVSRATVSKLERGQLGNVQLGTIRAVGAAIGIRVATELRGPGAELDRLLGAHHSAMHEAAARGFASLPDWVTLPEVTFSFFGERGAIDILAWHAPTRSLLVIELKTELVDVQETVGTLDRKVRLAGQVARVRGWEPLTVSAWLLIAESPTNRRRVDAHAAMLRSRFPADGRAMGRWLQAPAGAVAAMSFLSGAPRGSARRQFAPVRRVHRPRSRSATAVPDSDAPRVSVTRPFSPAAAVSAHPEVV